MIAWARKASVGGKVRPSWTRTSISDSDLGFPFAPAITS